MYQPKTQGTAHGGTLHKASVSGDWIRTIKVWLVDQSGPYNPRYIAMALTLPRLDDQEADKQLTENYLGHRSIKHNLC